MSTKRGKEKNTFIHTHKRLFRCIIPLKNISIDNVEIFYIDIDAKLQIDNFSYMFDKLFTYTQPDVKLWLQ